MRSKSAKPPLPTPTPHIPPPNLVIVFRSVLKEAHSMKCFVVLLIAISLFIPSFAHGATKVKIGFVNSITGPEAPIGENLSNGVTLAIEDLKKKGIDVELLKEDDTGKPETSMAAFEKLATSDKVTGIVGPYSSKCAAALAKLAEKYKVPLLIPVASKDDITRQN